MSNPEPSEEFYDTARVAELFGVTAETITNWCKKGGLFPNAFRINGRWRIPRADVLRLANSRYGS